MRLLPLSPGFAGWLVLVVLGGPLAGSLLGQESAGRNFRIHNVQWKLLEAPDFQFAEYPRRAVAASNASKWLRLEMDFDSEPAWADDVEVRWYAQVEGDDKPVVFATSIVHSDVKRNPRGQRHVTAVFMRPRTVERYVRSERGVKQVAVQIFHNGKLEDTWFKGGKERWWETVTPGRGALLDLTKTLFNHADGDRYEQIQVFER